MGRVLLLVFCAAQIVATPAIDFNRTHATHPLWTRHARFHLVWQIFSQCIFAAFAGWLAWHSGPGIGVRFYFAVAIVAIPLVGFLLATVTRSLYGGALYDPNGILPLRLTVLGKHIEVDGNLVVVVAGLMMLAGIVLVYCWQDLVVAAGILLPVPTLSALG